MDEKFKKQMMEFKNSVYGDDVRKSAVDIMHSLKKTTDIIEEKAKKENRAVWRKLWKNSIRRHSRRYY